MKRRNRKKQFECSHHYVGERFLVTDDPYPIYNYEDYCKIGKFNLTWGQRPNIHPCIKCKRFQLSRPLIRQTRRELKDANRYAKECNKICRIDMIEGRWEEDRTDLNEFSLI